MPMPAWIAGVIGGVIAGAVMALCITVVAPYRGFGQFVTPAKLVAVSVGGTDALDGGTRSMLLGAGLHFLVSAILGVIFALLMAVFGLTSLVIGARMGIVLGCGLIYALLIFTFNEYITLPLLNRPLLRHLPFIDFSIVHLIFGGVLAWTIVIFS